MLAEQLRDHLRANDLNPTIVSQNGAAAYRGFDLENFTKGCLDVVMMNLRGEVITKIYN